MERDIAIDANLISDSSTEPPGPASWSDDPNCSVCARVISAHELRTRDLTRCPFCGGDLVWPDEQPRGPRIGRP